MSPIISRLNAANQGRRTYYLGTPCKEGHVSERYTSNGACLQCLQRFRRTTINPWTKQLSPYMLPPGYFVPTEMTPELHAELGEFMHRALEHWVNEKGLITPSIQNAYSEATRHRLQHAKAHADIAAAQVAK